MNTRQQNHALARSRVSHRRWDTLQCRADNYLLHYNMKNVHFLRNKQDIL